MKVHTTNYRNAFIEVAEDTKAVTSKTPSSKNSHKTVAEMQYDLMMNSPYKYTSDDIIFQVYADRNDITEQDYGEAREAFFSKGQPCLRTSPLSKTHGFGTHHDSDGKVALYGMETQGYQKFMEDDDVKKVKAMRSSKK